jgi:hypothetical protein
VLFRDAGNGFTGIEVCLQVHPNVADRAKIEMAAKTAKIQLRALPQADKEFMKSWEV